MACSIALSAITKSPCDRGRGTCVTTLNVRLGESVPVEPGTPASARLASLAMVARLHPVRPGFSTTRAPAWTSRQFGLRAAPPGGLCSGPRPSPGLPEPASGGDLRSPCGPQQPACRASMPLKHFDSSVILRASRGIWLIRAGRDRHRRTAAAIAHANAGASRLAITIDKVWPGRVRRSTQRAVVSCQSALTQAETVSFPT